MWGYRGLAVFCLGLYAVLLFSCGQATEITSKLTTPQSAAPVAVRLPLTKAEARAFVETWFKAWVGGTPAVEGLLAFYARDAFYQDPNVADGIRGTEALRTYFRELLGNNPNWSYEIVDVYPTEKGLILNWKARIPLKGRVLENYKGVDILEFKDGLISHHEDYFDLSVFR